MVTTVTRAVSGNGTNGNFMKWENETLSFSTDCYESDDEALSNYISGWPPRDYALKQFVSIDGKARARRREKVRMVAAGQFSEG